MNPTRLTHTPIPEQQAVIFEVRSGSNSLMIEAGAGCAKSSTLEMAAPGIRQPALALAFNKKIASELAPRFPSNFKTKTLNGLGHQALARGLSAITSLVLDDRKLGKLVSQTAKQQKTELSGDQWDACRRLVSGVMQAGLVPDGGAASGLVPDEPKVWRDVAEGLWLTAEDFQFLYPLAREVLIENNALTRQGVISFDDQIYGSLLLGGRFPEYPVVFTDETQDFSILNREMIRKCVRRDGRLVMVGDNRQSIYSFRGTDSNSMRNVRGLRPEWMDLPLLTSFRCPKVVVERQQKHAPGFRAFHTNPDGQFCQLDSQESQPWTWASVYAAIPETARNASIAVLCRNNAPLFALGLKLLRRGIGIQMLGRDIGKSLQTLASKIAPEDSTPTDQTAGLILDWEERECALARANGREERCSSISDRAECLQAVLSNAECRTAGDLRAMLQKLFDRKFGQVVLSSIHRAKGQEWDTVIHLDPWRISSNVRQLARKGDTEAIQQEWNLLYVCETRTKYSLINANLENFR